MPKASQRKGRGGEIEAANEAEAFGLKTRVHGQWEALDISIEGEPYEVKRCEGLSVLRGYDALHAGAAGLIFRCNRQPWLLIKDYKAELEMLAELKQLRSQLNKLGEPHGIS